MASDTGWDGIAWATPIAKTLGWSEPGLVIVAVGIAAILGYVFAFKMLFEVAWWFKEKFAASKGFTAFLWWWPGMFFFLILLAIHIIHTLLFMWFGYNALVSVRDWWHKGARR